jgi:hypothetical protein
LMLELADFPMMRKLLLGIKRRAESLAASDHQSTIVPTAPAGSR